MELQEILRADPHSQYLFDILHSYFDLPNVNTDEKDPGADPLYEEKLFKILSTSVDDKKPLAFVALPTNKPPVARMWRYVFAVAGCIFLLLISYYFIDKTNTSYIHNQNKPAKINEITSKTGVRSKLVLPDGTLVWLNAGSKLIYSDDFNQKLREVKLEGEAFFDVTRDAGHPFIVHVSNINIIVKGTAFNVKSYPQDETVETTLLRGLIEVSRKDNPNGPLVILRPNEKLIFDKHLNTLAPRSSANHSGRDHDISITSISKTIPDSNKVETAWVYNRLVFDGDNFQELAEKMERWYNVKMVFHDRELLHYRFKGAFSAETIVEALNALQFTAKFSYQIDNNEIILFKK